ncbi:MAG: hypothetical protein R6U28_03530 [Cyclonatronaceae bacterium]
MKLNREIIKKLIHMVAHTNAGEIGCDECLDELDRFAEMKLAGKSPEKAMPLVAEHLEKCGECRQEFEALLEALRELKA